MTIAAPSDMKALTCVKDGVIAGTMGRYAPSFR